MVDHEFRHMFNATLEVKLQRMRAQEIRDAYAQGVTGPALFVVARQGYDPELPEVTKQFIQSSLQGE